MMFAVCFQIRDNLELARLGFGLLGSHCSHRPSALRNLGVSEDVVSDKGLNLGIRESLLVSILYYKL